jgi:hypothetical protein
MALILKMVGVTYCKGESIVIKASLSVVRNCFGKHHKSKNVKNKNSKIEV